MSEDQSLVPMQDQLSMLAVVATSGVPIKATGKMLTTLSLDDPKTPARIHSLMVGSSAELGELIGEIIDVSDITIYPKQVKDRKTGAYEEKYVCVLSGPDGMSYGTTSPHVLNSVLLWAAFAGNPPWNPPAKFVVRQRETANGRMFYLEAFSG